MDFGPLEILEDDALQKIYVWIDSIPLSRPKRNIARDLSDGGACVRGCAHPAQRRPSDSGGRWLLAGSWS